MPFYCNLEVYKPIRAQKHSTVTWKYISQSEHRNTLVYLGNTNNPMEV